MAKNINTMVVRNNIALNGIEIVFSEKASKEVRQTLNGQYHKVEGYQSMSFRWDGDKGLWYATNSKTLNKQVTKLIEELKANGYTDDENGTFKGKHVTVKVIDERTVEPTNPTPRRTNSNRRGNYRRNYRRQTATTTAPTKTAPVQTEPETVQTAPVQTVQATGYTKYDVQMKALELIGMVLNDR